MHAFWTRDKGSCSSARMTKSPRPQRRDQPKVSAPKGTCLSGSSVSSGALVSSLGFSRELGKSLLQILVSTKETGLKRCLLPEDEEVVATDLGNQREIILEL